MNQRTSNPKLVGLFVVAVVGTLSACYVLYANGAPSQQLVSKLSTTVNLWEAWKVSQGKTYENPAEEAYRFTVFQQNYETVMNTNAENLGYTLALNKFADLTSEEFKGLYCGYVPSDAPKNYENIEIPLTLPTSVNWTAAGAVTPVKNQGQCGSCWSFSASGALEGLNAIANGNLTSFSEQQLMDCSRKYGNKGCQGGLMDDAFEYVQAQGIETEAAYPYKAKDSLLCHYKAADVVFRITGHTDVTPNSEQALMAAVAQQPVSIAVEADQAAWQLYNGGVVTANCGTALDHGVLAVGYGATGGVNFWNVKNSWGPEWGMAGYILIQRSSADLCGVLMQPSYPTL